MVFILPSKLSGLPVIFCMGITLTPLSVRVLAVPPVEIILKFKEESAFAKSTMPDLSETLNSAYLPAITQNVAQGNFPVNKDDMLY